MSSIPAEKAPSASAPASSSHPHAERTAIARNALHLVLGQAGTTAVAILLSATLGRSLGSEEFGLYFLLTSLTTFAFVVVEWGQGQYLIREVARTPGRVGQLLGSGIALRVVGSLAAAVVTPVLTLLLGYGARSSALAALMLISFMPFFVSQAYGAAFRGHERMEYDAIVSIANKVLTLVLTLVAIWLRTGLVGVIVAQGVAGAGALLLAISFARRLGTRPARFAFETAREVLAGGTPIVAMSLAISAQSYIDAVVLSKLAPGQVLGWYGAARTVLGTLIAPATILGSASFPRLSRAAQDPALLREETQRALRPVLILAGYACVGTYLFADLAISIIYGKKGFGPAASILRVFTPGFFLLFIDVLLGAAIVATGRAMPAAFAKAANVALTTLLDFLLIPYCHTHYGNGGMGIVIAFGASELMMFVVAVYLLPRGLLGWSLVLDLVRAVGAAMVTLLAVSALPALPWPITLVTATALFAASAFATGMLRREHLAVFAALAPDRVAGRRGSAPGP